MILRGMVVAVGAFCLVAGAVMWAAYGALRGAPSIVLWNVVAAGLAALVLGLKLRGSRRREV